MAATQNNRLLKIDTPLGEDFLLLSRMSINEEISKLFSCDVELLHEENEDSYTPTDIDVSRILGKGVTISIVQRDGTSRTFSGMVNSFSRGNRTTRFSYYHATIVPHVWLLTQVTQSRIFQHKSVPDILREVFEGFEVSYEVQGSFKKRNYCVQYQETDFDFASRLMEEEGFYYYFEHSGGKHKMIVANTTQSHQNVPSKNSIEYFIKTERQEDFIGTIRDLWIDCRLQTGRVTLWDYNFQLPTNKLNAQQPSLFNVADNQKLENYVYPAGYGRKYDGIDRTGGENSGELQSIFEDNQRTVSNMMNALDSQYKVLSGFSDCSALTAGHRFTLTNHPNEDMNGQYIVTSIRHEAEQNPTYVTDNEVEEPYTSSFSCIPSGAGTPPYVPPRKTPKPFVQGPQTAIVVGPGGEEIFTDKYGRVKVQFNWDRHGKNDGDSSCWVRVAQSWASNGWGSMFIPRIGMEVIVHFEDGNPDKPIITGCVYNPQTMPAYTLPDEKTKSGIKTNSTKGGNGFNEFRFEDKKGEEQIFVHGEKDIDVRIKNDARELVKNDRHLIVENNQHEKVKRDKHLKVEGDKNEEVTGTTSLTTQNIQNKAKQNYALDATSEVHIKGGTNVVLESNTSLTLKVGGNFININSAGIFIKGTMVMINSGGAAGSGSGSSPTAPQEPIEADDAIPGSDAQRRTNPPPPLPKNLTPLGAMLSAASQNGSPFADP